MISSGDAVKLFLDIVNQQAIKGTYTGIEDLLKEGPPGRLKKQDYVKFHEWYRNLGEQDKEIVLNIIREAINRTIFNLLVILDNKVGNLLEGDISDLTLNLQIYTDRDNLFKYNPQEITRINKSYSIDGDLHDIFTDMIK